MRRIILFWENEFMANIIVFNIFRNNGGGFTLTRDSKDTRDDSRQMKFTHRGEKLL